MKLIEIFNQLTFGELSQISIGGIEGGEINDKNYYAILSHINLGLIALYRRFPLKEGRLTLALQQGRYTYPITSTYAVNNTKSTELIKYIEDSVSEKFTDDINKIESVFTDTGFELALNDEANVYSVRTPSATILTVPPLIVAKSVDLPDEYKTDKLTLVYRANHPIIDQDVGSFDPSTYEVQLPYSHLEALLYFVASRVNNPIGMVNEFHAGNSYAAKYEQACQQLEISNMRVDQFSQPDRISRNGWV